MTSSGSPQVVRTSSADDPTCGTFAAAVAAGATTPRSRAELPLAAALTVWEFVLAVAAGATGVLEPVGTDPSELNAQGKFW